VLQETPVQRCVSSMALSLC